MQKLEVVNENEVLVERKQIREYLEEVKMSALRKNLLRLYDDIEGKLKENPASIKYHHNYTSGLYVHTLEVMEYAVGIFELYKDQFVNYFNRDDVILVSFIHDLEKTTKYKRNMSPNVGRNKYETEFLYNDKKIDINDTAEVVNLVSRYNIFLTDMQLNSLGFHHGGYSTDKGQMGELACLLHAADLFSTRMGVIHKLI